MVKAHRHLPPTACLRPKTHHGPVIVQRESDFVPNEIIGLQDIVKLRSVSPQFRNYIDDSIIIQRRLFRVPDFQVLSRTGPAAGWPQCLPTLPSRDNIGANIDDDERPVFLFLSFAVFPDTTESNDQSTPIHCFENTLGYWKDMYITQPPIIAAQILTRSECGEHRNPRAFSVECQSGIKLWHIMSALEREKELRHMHEGEEVSFQAWFHDLLG